MAVLRGWFAGRKTYLVAGAVCLAVLVLVFLGRLTPEAAMAIALFALGLFGATFRSALAAHQADVLVLLNEIAQTGKFALSRNAAGTLQFGAQAIQDGVRVVDECGQEAKG